MREGWRSTTLGEVLAPINDRAGLDGPDLVLSVTEKRGIIPQDEVFRKRIATKDVSKYKVLQPMDIAFNPYLAWCGALGQWLGSEPGVTSPVYECFRVVAGTEPRFIGLVLESGLLTPYFDATAVGSIQRRRRTTVPVFEAAPLHIPTAREQARIVDLIDTIDLHLAALRELTAAASSTRDALVLDALRDSSAMCLPTTIGQIADVKGGKRLPKGTPWSDTPTAHRYIRATDVSGGRILEDDLVYVPDDVWPRICRYVVAENDLVITIAGTIGAVARVQKSLMGANLTENAARIQVDSSLIMPEYLEICLRTEATQAQIAALTVGTSQRKLALFRIEDIEVPLPPLDEQRRLVSLIEAADSSVLALESCLATGGELRLAILLDLLTGVHEIPASYDELLERVS